MITILLASDCAEILIRRTPGAQATRGVRVRTAAGAVAAGNLPETLSFLTGFNLRTLNHPPPTATSSRTRLACDSIRAVVGMRRQWLGCRA